MKTQTTTLVIKTYLKKNTPKRTAQSHHALFSQTYCPEKYFFFSRKYGLTV